MNEKVSLISLGCPKNLINSEQMLNLLDDAGYTLVDDPEGADVAIVNTCGFIDSAKMEAIDTILGLSELKAQGKLKKIIAVGCLTERYKAELTDEMPEIDAAMGTNNYQDIISLLEKALRGDRPLQYGDISAPIPETGRIVTTGPSWAYIQIAEGCDNRCAFCTIPSFRGRYRSRGMEEIVKEAAALAEGGVRELVLIAQDVTHYGRDLYGRLALPELLKKLSKVEGLRWIRMHYLYPAELSDELIDTIAEDPKLLPYFDIPMQHINDNILRRMRRRDTGKDIRLLLKRIRERIPDAVIRTSLIAGLPGEGEAEFEELCDFLREAKLQRAGVFPFSPEEGTDAAAMEHVEQEVAERRAELISEIQDGIMLEYEKSRLGTTVTVLCEGWDEDSMLFYGRSMAEAPEVDGRILFAGDAEPGNMYEVQLKDLLDSEPFGEIVSQE